MQEANKDGLRQRMADMVDYLKTEPEEVMEYSEILVRRMIEKITVYDDHFVVEFKSGLEYSGRIEPPNQRERATQSVGESH